MINKKNLSGVLVIAVALLVGGYFAFAKYAKLPKRQIKLENKSIAELNTQPTEDGRQAVVIGNQETESAQQQIGNNQSAEISKQEVVSGQQEIKNNQNSITNDPTVKKEVVKNNGQDVKIISKLISWGFEKSAQRKIDTIIVHSSFDALGPDPYDVEGVVAEYRHYGVSAHYLIGRDGKTYQLVADQSIAYHAGVSRMPDGRTGVNAFSIGIEMLNTESDKYTAAQYEALNGLIAKLKKSYSIKYVLGHKDIAPGRKTDPWGMEWDKVQK